MLQVCLFIVSLFLPAGIVLALEDEGAPSAIGQEDRALYLPEVTITAPLDLLELQEKVSPLDTIPQETLDRSPSLGKGLMHSPAVLARSYSGVGSLESVQLRGLPASSTLILLDGVPLRFPLSGAPDFTHLPAPAVERVRILRGGGSHLYGSNAIAGVIAIETTPARKETGVLLRGGGYGEGSGVVRFSHPGYFWGALGMVASSGDYPYPAGERIESTCEVFCLIRKDRYREGLIYGRRVNNGFLQGRGNLGFGIPIGEGLSSEIRLYGTTANKEVPGSLETSTPLGEQENIAYRAMGRVRLKVRDRGVWEVALARDGERIEYRDGLFVPLTSPSLSRAMSLGVFLHGYQPIGEGFALSLYGDRRYEAGTLPDGRSPSRHPWGGGGVIQFDQTLWGVQGGVRVDGVLGRDPVWVPTLGGFYAPFPFLVLKGEIHQGYRDPTFNDLYWPRQAGAVGNPNLKPERSHGGGIFAELNTPYGFLSMGGYEERVQELILWRPTSGIWSPQNIGVVRSRGIELSARSAPIPSPLLKPLTITILLSYAYRLAENRDPQLFEDIQVLRNRGVTTCPREGGHPQIPLVPLHQGGGEILGEVLQARGGVGVRVQGERAVGTDNTTCLPGMGELYGFIEYKLETTETFLFRLRGENLLNQYNEEVPGYPAPPRALYAELEVRL
jgi:outer membrane cobalamin receptor